MSDKPPLIGPNPTLKPIYPTPWTKVKNIIYDADGTRVSEFKVRTGCDEIARLVVQLMNKHAGLRPQVVDNGGDLWFDPLEYVE